MELLENFKILQILIEARAKIMLRHFIKMADKMNLLWHDTRNKMRCNLFPK